MALDAKGIKDFQIKLTEADDGDGTFTTEELAKFEEGLKKEGFFEKNGIDEQAFNMQLHHYDNKKVKEAESGFGDVFASGRNLFGDSLFNDGGEKKGDGG